MALQIDRLALWKEKPAGAGVDPDSAGCAAGAAAGTPAGPRAGCAAEAAVKHTHGPRARRPGRSRAGVRADTHSAAPPPPLSATEAGRGPPSPGRRRWRPRRAPRPGPAPARRGRGRSRASRSPRGAGLSARGAPPFWSPLSRSCDSLHLRGGRKGLKA